MNASIVVAICATVIAVLSLAAPTECSSTANGTYGQSLASTPVITTGTARTSPASNDLPTRTAKSAFRWTCRLSGGRRSAA